MADQSTVIIDPLYIPVGAPGAGASAPPPGRVGGGGKPRPVWEIGMNEIGATCYQEMPIYLHMQHSRVWQIIERPFEPEPGFLIVATEISVRGRLGDSVGPIVVQVQANSALQTFEAAKESGRKFLDFAASAMAQLQAKGIDTKKAAEVKARFESEYQLAMEQQTTHRMNNRGLRITAKVRATTDALGLFWKSGGMIDATVRIYMVYVGSPAYFEGLVARHAAQLQGLLEETSDAQALQTTSVSAIADTYVRADVNSRKNDNYGLERIVCVGTGRGSSVGPFGAPDAIRALVKFSLGGLPREFEKATLEMTVHSVGGSAAAPFSIGVYQVLQPWVEGNGAESNREPLKGAATDPDSAIGVAWEAIDQNNEAQPEFAAQALAVVNVDPRSVTPGTVIRWDVTAMVRQWADDPGSNHGFVLRDTGGGATFRQLAFGSREAELFTFADAVTGPRLVLEHR